ncbi:MAG: TolC family protein [Bacteroidaceae bacterium]|nr:TolC family protein [Bacteroidaceae bacterium]
MKHSSRILMLACMALMMTLSGQSVAQTVLSLEECRAMALENNGQSRMAQEKVNAAEYDIKTAFANYLPKVSATALYLHNSENINLADEDQRNNLSGMGTSLTSGIQTSLMTDPAFLSLYMNDNTVKNTVNYIVQKMSAADVEGTLNQIGQDLSDDLTLDIRNVYVGLVTVEEPLYVGGKIRAYNKVTAYAKELAETQLNGEDQKVLVTVDEAYWQIVSVANKLRLTNQYVDLLRQMDRNVEIMKQEGVATTSDQLSVRVKLNEAEMSQIKAQNGLALSKMLLCQLCGMPLDSEIVLKDEMNESLDIPADVVTYTEEDLDENRPELKSLQLAVNMYDMKSKIVRADYLPTVALMGNYLVTNPSANNGFANDFHGMWNVGVVAKIPVFHFGEGVNKYRRAKSDIILTQYQLDDARGKVSLQVSQYEKKIAEADSRLEMALKNMENAEENLRVANIGFKEGVVESSLVLAAQTAWLKAHSEEIDARIDRIMATVYLRQATGQLK